MQTLNLCLTFFLAVIAYLCFFHTTELTGTALGRALLAGLSLLWLFRMALQPLLFPARQQISWAFTALFLAGAGLSGLPLLL